MKVKGTRREIDFIQCIVFDDRDFYQALALAILNGTADKLELEKREKEENEWVIVLSMVMVIEI